MILFRYHTPVEFDDLVLCTDGEALNGLWFEGSRKPQFGCAETQSFASQPLVVHDTCRWLDLYFTGHQPDFMPYCRIDGLTPFRREVLEIMREIPFGKTMSYGEIASQICQKHGLAKMSAQAVGGAVGWNPIGIILPCHRVVGANGKLTGYGGGMHNKIALLRLERHAVNCISMSK